MSPEADTGPAADMTVRRCKQIARAASLLAIGIGLLVLAGWCFDLRPLMTVLPGLVAMKPNTAIAFCLAGLSLFHFLRSVAGRSPRTRQISIACALAVSVLGALALLEYASGWNIGIDELLFRDRFSSGAPGRMAPISAFNFVCLGLALVFIHFPKRIAWAHALTSCAAFSSLLAIVGYFYGVVSLFQTGNFTAVALHTAVAFLTLCIGVWCATSRYGFMKVVAGSGTSGKLLRRLGGAALVLPFLFDWLQMHGELTGWYGPELAAAIFAVANVATFTLLVWFGASSLRKVERTQALVQESLIEAHLELEQRVRERTEDLATANAALQLENAERKQVENALRESEGRFQLVARATEDAIWDWNIVANTITFSDSLGTLFGYHAGQFASTMEFWMSSIHPEDHDPVLASVQAFFASPSESWSGEYRFRCADGSYASVYDRAHVVRDEDGKPIRMVGTMMNVTERKRAEEELCIAKEAAEAASRAKSEFLANMSHEIRTPMNGIIGMTELVLDTKLDREQREYLGMAKSSARSLLGLINDILDFSKIEAGKLDLETISFSLRDCLGTMLKPLGLRADQKGLELTADIPAEMPDHLIGDPMRLRQVLSNLTDNAIKFTEHGDVMLRVEVESATGQEHCLHFSVTDTGIGIPASKQALIFESFSQADGSTTRTYGGTGLGLAIATQLVRQMGGRLWVESTEGEGTTFHFTVHLPVRHTPALNVRHADARQLNGLRVLVVDDNAVNRRILRGMLTNWQMQPAVVASGAAAIVEMLRAAHAGTPFPLVILDGMMPGMDGFMVAEKIREHAELNGVTVMMLSSAMPGGAAARCSELGVASYLTKPVSQSELLDAILIAIGGAVEIASEADPAPVVQAAGGLRILLAEDNVINRTVAAAILKKGGHSLVHAANGREAVEAAAREAFDLIFMDVQMPEMDGFEATRLIRASEQESGQAVPIVAMTAHAMAGDRERCLAAGMDDYLSKPLQKAELLALLDRVRARKTSIQPAVERTREPSASTPTLSIFSRETLLDEFDDDEALLQRMVALFQSNTQLLLEDIREATHRQHPDDLACAAHALLSSLGAFGAKEAHRLALRIEDLARSSDLSHAGQAFSDLECETTRVCDAIQGLTEVRQ
ncbi:MAG: two-component system, sensor histidine kinase and response regulator [Chthoniobacter sp.]|jgi:PAS domain S-box-containing protein|nr:two-component system, sensor histidine kinase and response regulator [Chthoniobacter sp.]